MPTVLLRCAVMADRVLSPSEINELAKSVRQGTVHPLRNLLAAGARIEETEDTDSLLVALLAAKGRLSWSTRWALMHALLDSGASATHQSTTDPWPPLHQLAQRTHYDRYTDAQFGQALDLLVAHGADVWALAPMINRAKVSRRPRQCTYLSVLGRMLKSLPERFALVLDRVPAEDLTRLDQGRPLLHLAIERVSTEADVAYVLQPLFQRGVSVHQVDAQGQATAEVLDASRRLHPDVRPFLQHWEQHERLSAHLTDAPEGLATKRRLRM